MHGLKVWAVVPVKALSSSKQRLALALGPRREAFARALLAQTLFALAGSRLVAGVLVVTADPEVADEARQAGAEVLQEEADLNTACAHGLAEIRARGGDICAIIHADLALLSPRGVDALICAYLESRRVQGESVIGLVRCRQGTGTNVVLIDPRLPFTPAFGPASFAAHQLAAGPRAKELHSQEAAFDVDTDADLDRLTGGVVPARLRPFVGLSLPLGPEALSLGTDALEELVARASRLRDVGHGALVTYSRKVFLPLTQLCRDTCHYCTFAKTPRRVGRPFMSVDEAVATAAAGAKRGCKEALFTLGEKPELRYNVAKSWLAEAGFDTTLHYVAHVAAAVRDQTGLLPHINAGCMTAEEIAMLRPVSASMGLMLESVSDRLCMKGAPHYGSPDKVPAVRLATIAEAGRQRVPFTTGILIGIGETRAERIDSLLAIRALHERYGHIQEIIIQNFLPKPGTRMTKAIAPPLEELVWTVSVARILFGPYMNIQAPPNLNPGVLGHLVEAGVNDWGGVSPLTPDYVNPEAPWPQIERLHKETALAGKILTERLTIYPSYARAPDMWLDPAMRRSVLELSDGSGHGREDYWRAGRSAELPVSGVYGRRSASVSKLLTNIIEQGAQDIGEDEVERLFEARDSDFAAVCEAADHVRTSTVGNVATYVVNRNINYTNICTYGCGFCAFSKGKRNREGAEKPYLLELDEIGARVQEAWMRGATEVCLQGGIHPSFTGETYVDILRAVKKAVPAIHVHAFSPLEILHGATTLGLSLPAYLRLLRDEGLGSLPGTAAEILDDGVRQVLCPDKLNTGQWLEVIDAAHSLGLRTTATIMFGHVDDYRSWARHLLSLRDLQKRTDGFTEFVPLPFVAHEAPLYKRGRARPGPTFREAVLMHAVARLVLHPYFSHIQTSWVKMGHNGMRAALQAGADDLGGTLMNESITRAAGAIHGQEMTVEDMRALANSLGRVLVRRNTLYVGAPGDGLLRRGERQESPLIEA
ncbi:MAG: synthase [Gammaproteobacteria bacterium]|nr:synthase [Gammaproteobacteria bacterium]